MQHQLKVQPPAITVEFNQYFSDTAEKNRIL